MSFRLYFLCFFVDEQHGDSHDVMNSSHRLNIARRNFILIDQQSIAAKYIIDAIFKSVFLNHFSEADPSLVFAQLILSSPLEKELRPTSPSYRALWAVYYASLKSYPVAVWD